MAVIDTFTYNGELKILQLHLGVLEKYVDKFVIVEANKTFTGQDKPLYFFRDQRFFKPWWSKIDYYVMDQWDDPQLWDLANKSAYTKGASHWKREFYIKESLGKALKNAGVKDDDTVFLGDVDEIIDPTAHFISSSPVKAKLRVYSYHLNNRSSEEFWGTTICQYGDIKNGGLNDLRNNTTLRSQEYLGWHFTSMGGLKEIERKLNDSYTHESYNMNLIPGHVESCFRERKDLLNRPFTYTLDESDWPKYLTLNRNKFSALIYGN